MVTTVILLIVLVIQTLKLNKSMEGIKLNQKKIKPIKGLKEKIGELSTNVRNPIGYKVQQTLS